MAAKDAALIVQAGRDGGVDLPMAATYLVARNDG